MEIKIDELKGKVKELQINKLELWKDLNDRYPNTLSQFGGYDFILSEVERILCVGEYKESYYEYLEEHSRLEEEEKRNEEEYFSEQEKERNEKLDEYNEQENIFIEKQYKREKKNKLRKLRLDDLNKLIELRGVEFTPNMQLLYDSLKRQYIKYENELYIDREPIPYYDFWKINNIKLIEIFEITEEEQKSLKSIIDKEEKSRRRNERYKKDRMNNEDKWHRINEKRRKDRRNDEGLLESEVKKKLKEDAILKLIKNNPEIKKSEVAKILGLHKSSISKTYKHLF